MSSQYFISDRLQEILKKIKLIGVEAELTEKDKNRWLEYFMYVISGGYTLTPQQITTSHDWWLRTIEYQSNVDDTKFEKFEEIVEKRSWDSLQDFLSFVVSYFSFEELMVVEI